LTFATRAVSPDGRVVIAIGPDQQPAFYPVAGGEPQPITALGDDLVPIGWSETSDAIFARSRTLSRLVPVFKVDLASGRRQAIAQVGLADPKGAPLVLLLQVSRDGRRYAYYSSQTRWTLFLIEGVKP
jgi:hypothetical protein